MHGRGNEISNGFKTRCRNLRSDRLCLVFDTTRSRHCYGPLSFRMVGQREIEGRSFIGRGLHPDLSSITLYNPLTNSKANSRPRVGTSMKPLENAENL